jgi:hypothetical protein
MHSLVPLLLCGLLLPAPLLALALHESWTQCEGAAAALFDLQDVQLSAQTGTASLRVSGTLKEGQVAAGSLTATVYYAGWPVSACRDHCCMLACLHA